MTFIHLQVFSAYSLLSSTATVDKLVIEAKKKGYRALALTDRNVMHGTIPFYNKCLQEGIKPILGLTADVLSVRDEESEHGYPLILLAKNEIGFQNLLKISSVIQTKSNYGIPIKWLKHYAKGLFAISDPLEGEVEELLKNNRLEEAERVMKTYQSLFEPNSFFLGVSKTSLNEELELLTQKKELVKETGIDLIATNSVHYIQQEDAFAFHCLSAIKSGEKLADIHPSQLERNEQYLKTAKEMTTLFGEIPEVLEQTILLSEQCNVHLNIEGRHLPSFPVETGVTVDDLLEEQCFEGLKRRFNQPEQQYIERLKYEIDVIKRMQFSDYFLIVADFMSFAHKKGILTGPGRGSAAGSLVAYCLSITDVDPIKYELLFERFLNPERVSMPDIDIDFPDHRRDEVIQYVAEKYGELHVAQIVTFGTLAAKAAARDVGRVFGLNTKELEQLSRLIPSKLGITLQEALRESDGLKRFIQQSEHNKQLFETALKLEGLPRHTSTHAAGVVISKRPLVEMVPIQAGSENLHLTQYSMDILEQIGLLKMDFLGLRNLTLIENILTSIERQKGKRIQLKNIPFDDEKTFALLSKGMTNGIFQLESEGMRKVLMQLEPTEFEDIVAVNALFRPGPMENIPLYINRKHGKESVQYPHPDLEPILKNTHGVIVYQEQIMKIASSMAGFSLGEADLLRRAVSKKKKEVLDQERNHFVSGAIRKGYTKQVAEEIYDLIVRFANYGFNRSHAVAYSMISYQLAYLKAHYPLYFMSALMTAVVGNDDKIFQYIQEIKQLGYSVLPPSIKKSYYGFQVEGQAIRYSLMAIKGVGAQSLKSIFQVRAQKNFTDLFDFCLRVSPKAVNRKTLEALVHSGSLDEFGEDRATLLASLDVALEHAELVRPTDDEQIDFFAEDEFHLKPKYVEVEPIRMEDKLAFEKAVLGLYLSSHPVTSYAHVSSYYGAIPIIDIQSTSEKVVKVAVYVTSTKSIRTKNGEAMAFASFSDESGDMEAVIFPTVYKRIQQLIKQGELLLVEGKVEVRSEKTQLIIHNAQKLQEIEVPVQGIGKLYIKITSSLQTPDKLLRIKQILQGNNGDTPVFLYYEKDDKTVALGKQDWIQAKEFVVQQLESIVGKGNVILKL